MNGSKNDHGLEQAHDPDEEAESRIEGERLIGSGFCPRIHDRGLDPTQALGNCLLSYVQRELRALVNIADVSAYRVNRTCLRTLSAGRCSRTSSSPWRG
jgi:hypothetical protein